MKDFNSPTSGKLSIEKIAKIIGDYIKKNPYDEFQLVIGTDSNGSQELQFVTAIVIYRKGKGGRYFYKKFSKSNIFHLKHKIYAEATASLETGQKLLQSLRKYWNGPDLKGALEIHIDVGENGPTKELVKEITGMVLSQGFRAKIKPYSYAASLVADRHT